MKGQDCGYPDLIFKILMIWSAKTNWDLTSNNLIKTNTLRGNQESRFEIPDFGQNTLGIPYQSSSNQMDELYRINEKRSVDFWTDMLSDQNESDW